ncbi:hypothetical protein MP228_004016 [Amoeboaphelidium protococcarum]|nr:hypothetical protein MP228_004016 [Amoeboaphelidium protococcarum]
MQYDQASPLGDWQEQIQRAKLNNNFIGISSSEDSESASDEELSSVPPAAFSVAAHSGSSIAPASSLSGARPLSSGAAGPSSSSAQRPPLRLEKAHPSLSSPSFQRRYGVTPTRPAVKVRSTAPGVVSSSSVGDGPVSGSSVFAPSSPPVHVTADSAVGSSISSQKSASVTGSSSSQKQVCSNCALRSCEIQQLELENSRLRATVERLEASDKFQFELIEKLWIQQNLYGKQLTVW